MSDTGIGLTEEQKGALFQAFAQADASTTRKYGGTGLGLAISKRLSELMGGEIGVESQAGAGSTFWFTARFGLSDAARQTSRRDRVTLGSLRILVVDDNPSSRTILGRLLQSFGCSFEPAASGEEALARLSQAVDPFDLILLDWRMPGMGGIEVARRLRQVVTAGRIPKVVMISAYDRDEVMSDAGDLDIAGYLIKPVNPGALADAIMEAIGQRMSDRPAAAKQGKPLAAKRTWTGVKLLVVEDNELNQILARDVLEQAGFTVTIVENGQIAVDTVQRQNFDGVLMDVQMPVMDGFTATRTIRADQRFKDLPIIAMTANAMSGDREKALEAGMNDYVAKPLDLDKMFAVLRAWLPVREGEPLIDTEAALNRAGGNGELMKKLQKIFIGTLDEFPPSFRSAIAGDRVEETLRLAHTLKGSAGTIGAAELQRAAGALERALVTRPKERPTIEALFVDVESAIARVRPVLAAEVDGPRHRVQ